MPSKETPRRPTPNGETLTIPVWAHGRPGMGQGGWGSGSFAQAIGEPVSIALRAPIPLETPLAIEVDDEGWNLVRGDSVDRAVIMRAHREIIDPVDTPPVSLDQAFAARDRFDTSPDAHEARTCFSCGLAPDSMQVWPGPLNDGTGRVATVWTPRSDRADDKGHVDPRVVWTTLDCTSGFYVGQPDPDDADGERRHGLTVQYSVRQFGPVVAEQPHVLVGHHGRHRAGWDGRKRGAGASLFDAEGTLLAYADSFWLSVPA